jgi:hypothetical protein
MVLDKSSVILVGNGVTKNMGHLVDRHDVVIRLNGFKIKGYEHLVGEKTTIWSFSAGLWNRIKHLYHSYEKRWFHGDYDHKKKFLKNFDFSENDEVFTKEEVSLIKQEINDCLGKSLLRPTTGIRSIFIAMRKFEPPISLVGFDGYKNLYHYYDVKKGSKSLRHHDMKGEMQVIDILEERGMVKVLDKGFMLL